MRPLDAVFADAASSPTRARSCARQDSPRTRGRDGHRADEAERLTQGAIVAGIEGGLVQGLEAALRGLREARAAAGGAEPAWLRRLLDGLG